MSDDVREALEVDVLFVGAGPANLAAAYHLARLIESHNATAANQVSPMIAMIEKSANIGDHILSGAVLDPRALDELIPGFRDEGGPFHTPVSADKLWFLTESGGFDAPFLPPMMRNQGSAAITPEQLYVLASQDTSKFQEAVPEYQEFTGLIEELLVLSNRARLNITQISYSSEELKQSPLLKFSLNFNVAGDYEQVKKFIHSLEQSVRLITIKQISLQSSDNDGVNLRLSLETFFRPGSREP